MTKFGKMTTPKPIHLGMSKDDGMDGLGTDWLNECHLVGSCVEKLGK
jgi:hypothetical protein